MHLLPRILSQFPDTEIPVRSAPWRGKLFLLHRCRTYPAFMWECVGRDDEGNENGY